MFGKKDIFKHKMGYLAKDKVTGFVGTIVARTEYLTGCNQYCLTPEAKDGEYKDSVYIDEDRIEIISKIISPDEVTGEEKGGPCRRVRI